jgi:anti-sigma B factor antagonist/stage II sporulation protein AA (anti-sigma F factor antagonist)
MPYFTRARSEAVRGIIHPDIEYEEQVMNLPLRESAGVLIATVSGRIDHASANAFNSALEPLLKNCVGGAKPLILDFSGVEYISSVGLRSLMLASRQAKSQKGAFAIAGMQPSVQEVFTISRFSLIMPCYTSIEAACKVLGS